MQLLGWLLVCCLFSMTFRTRPTVCIITITTLWLLVPAIGGSVLTGQVNGLFAAHPATWLIMSCAVTQAVRKPGAMLEVVGRRPYTFLALGLAVSGAVVTTAGRVGGGGTVLLVDQVVAPILFFVLILTEASRSGHLVRRLRVTLLILGAVISAVAFAQWISGSVLFYEEGFTRQYWFDPADERWMSVLDQPLVLSMVLCVISPLTAGTRAAIQIPLLALMGGAVIISQSRTGLATYVAVLLFLVLSSRTGFLTKVGMIVGLGIAGSVLLTTPLAAGVLSRIADDTGSSAARSDAVGYFFTNWLDYLFVGGGIGSSYGVAEEGGLRTSLESSYLMYAVDLGIVFASLYFGALVVLVMMNLRQTKMRGLGLAGLLVISIPQTFSALATRSAAGVLLWLVVAMLVAAGEQNARRTLHRNDLGSSAAGASAAGAPARRTPRDAT